MKAIAMVKLYLLCPFRIDPSVSCLPMTPISDTVYTSNLIAQIVSSVTCIRWFQSGFIRYSGNNRGSRSVCESVNIIFIAEISWTRSDPNNCFLSSYLVDFGIGLPNWRVKLSNSSFWLPFRSIVLAPTRLMVSIQWIVLPIVFGFWLSDRRVVLPLGRVVVSIGWIVLPIRRVYLIGVDYPFWIAGAFGLLAFLNQRQLFVEAKEVADL